MTAERENRGSPSVTAALQTLNSLRQAGVRQLGKPDRGKTAAQTARAAIVATGDVDQLVG